MNHIFNARLRGRTGLFTLRWLDGRISAIGPKGSLFIASASSGTSASAVGWKK